MMNDAQKAALMARLIASNPLLKKTQKQAQKWHNVLLDVARHSGTDEMTVNGVVIHSKVLD